MEERDDSIENAAEFRSLDIALLAVEASSTTSLGKRNCSLPGRRYHRFATFYPKHIETVLSEETAMTASARPEFQELPHGRVGRT